MTYWEDDPTFDKRLEWYKDYVLPRLLAQTDPNFDIAIKCNPSHINKIQAIHERIIPFWAKGWDTPLPKEDAFICKDLKPIRKHDNWSDIVGLEKYHIQSNLDSDDFISETYIARVKEEVQKTDMLEPMHIHFQPDAIDPRKDLVRIVQKAIYGPKLGSAFLSIYQPNDDNYMFVRHASHRTMPLLFKRTVLVEKGYCWIVVNGNNYKTVLGWL
jgi:hypothetical protein